MQETKPSIHHDNRKQKNNCDKKTVPIIPDIQYQDKTIVFCADMLPTAGHIPIPYVTGYDTRPLLSMDEKEIFLKAAADNSYYLWLEHDAHNQIITVQHTEKGVRLKDVFTCNEILK